jgi:hypothetical protein
MSMQNYSGVKAPVRKKVEEVSREAYERYIKGDTTAIPHWMQIRAGDSEKQREKKVRAIKAFKKKMRCVLWCSLLSRLQCTVDALPLRRITGVVCNGVHDHGKQVL